MRVYEFAKKNNTSSRVVLEILKGGGFTVANHMVVLEQDQIDYFKKQFSASGHMDDAEVEKKIMNEKTTERERPPVKQQIADQKKSLEESKIILTDMLLGNLANKIGISSSELIMYLLKQGIVCSKNQIISKDMVELIAQHYEKEVVEPQENKSAIVEPIVKKIFTDKLRERLPIVAVVGHVDHGKTTLLDFIRKTRVATKEKGGITQHLGAYQAKTVHGKIVFLDTPGHEAFLKMRMRGVKVADIVILIVAADDGIMPQTIEAIRHAKSMEVPIIVAINKIDKVDPARVEVVKGQLAKYELLPEEWGGQTVCVGVSAKEGTGVDHLLEMIILQSQLMELKADQTIEARGYVLESKLQKGRGPVATIICQHGILKIGDYFVCGDTFGRVNALSNSAGERVESIEPSAPVQVSGFDELPQVGDYFQVISEQEFRKAKSEKGKYRMPVSRALYNQDSLGIIVKSDTHSSQEALLDSIERLSLKTKDQKELYIIHAGVGDISESDIILASNTSAIIVGFNVKMDTNAADLAQRNTVSVTIFGIIYKLLDHIQELLKQREPIKMETVKTGEAIVRKVFDIKGVGVIAGSYVKDGRFSRDSMVKVWRGRDFIGEGKIKSLQRERKVVKEVHAGFECGFVIDGITDWEVDDRVECFVQKPVGDK